MSFTSLSGPPTRAGFGDSVAGNRLPRAVRASLWLQQPEIGADNSCYFWKPASMECSHQQYFNSSLGVILPEFYLLQNGGKDHFLWPSDPNCIKLWCTGDNVLGAAAWPGPGSHLHPHTSTASGAESCSWDWQWRFVSPVLHGHASSRQTKDISKFGTALQLLTCCFFEWLFKWH